MELLIILNEWDPIPGSPSDEYDCLCHSILSLLNRKSNESALTDLILYELVGHFGFGGDQADVEDISQKIYKWWKEKYDV